MYLQRPRKAELSFKVWRGVDARVGVGLHVLLYPTIWFCTKCLSCFCADLNAKYLPAIQSQDLIALIKATYRRRNEQPACYTLLLLNWFRANMLPAILIALGALFVASAAAVLVFDNKQRDVVLRRFDFRRRRATGFLTPPRSLSPEKQGLPSNKASSEPDYSDTYPPSRRKALADLPPGALRGNGKSAKELAQVPPDYGKRLPSEEAWDTDELADHVTATGFSVEEIKRLGDFPDYAVLSGIPLPDEYKGFDIAKAKPRPFRPLRWAYHQTMCQSPAIIW